MPCRESICVRDNYEQLVETAADIFAVEAGDAVRERARFSVALSGGSTPRGMHRLLVKDPWLARIPWAGTHIFWVDERCVPPHSPWSNYGSAKRDFLEDTPLLPDQIHPMVCGASASEAAETYQDRLLKRLPPDEGPVPRFDLIYLGLGEDGHTASLFPGQPLLWENEKLVVAVKGGGSGRGAPQHDIRPFKQGPSCGFPWFRERGNQRSPRSVLTNPGLHLPANEIKPLDGKLTWLLDADAASLLPERLKHAAVHR